MDYLFLSFFLGLCSAESPALLQDSFEQGVDSPDGWQTSEGSVLWSQDAHTGQHSIAVVGGREQTVFWLHEDIAWEPHATYRLSFFVKVSPDASDGTIVSGPSSVNRDFQATSEWQERQFIFTMPDNVSGHYLRLGTWHKRGTVWFDDVLVTQVQPIHRMLHGVTLGEGEQILRKQGQTRYRFRAPLEGNASNSARALWHHTSSFNSNRWTMGTHSEVIYQHQVGTAMHQNASVDVHIGHYTSGVCVAEASSDAQDWTQLGTLDGLGTQQFSLPASMLPGHQVFVRLRAEGEQPSFQVYGYTFESGLDTELPEIQGSTDYLEERVGDAAVQVKVNSLGELRPGGDNEIRLTLAGLSAPTCLSVHLGETEVASTMATNGSVQISYPLLGAGKSEFSLTLGDEARPLYQAATQIQIPLLYAADYGYLLSEDACIWWAEATHKISRERPMPTKVEEAVMLEAAQNEYEPVQVVLRPERTLHQVRVEAQPFRQGEHTIGADQITVSMVDYVPVKVPTDAVGCVGDWPDPLPPHREPFDVPTGQNQPLWITVHVPKGVPAGDYLGSLSIKCEEWECTVPMKLHVWDFELPDETPVESGFGFSAGSVRQYHQLESDDELRITVDRYLQNFATHRISPYNAMMLDPIRVEFDMESLTASLDVSDFDKAAERYLDELGFSGFRLALHGMGGGTFHSRRVGKIGDYEQGTPEYETLFGSYLSQLSEHLESKGWLTKAYVYWFDEPDPKDYEFVADGMERIKRYAPGLTRLLTEQPEPELGGSVDLWCPVTYHYNHELAEERRAAGEKFWWYVCTGPKEPYCTLFIDHHAVEMRLWLWQTWKYGVNGILVWQTCYWTSSLAFPAPDRQNPYEDAMGYQTGYGRPVGYIGYWGNGDGRFLYPPKKAAYGEKSLDGPVNSIRWELLREGIEDYIYFWMLEREIRRLEGSEEHVSACDEAKALLQVPTEVVENMTEFTKDPAPMYSHRRQLARTLEHLKQLR